MSYDSPRFKEHHHVRLPVLESLLELGWDREQIVCPSPSSEDTEWRVPKNPSSSALREKGASFEGFPCDIAIFDSVTGRGDAQHLSIIVECKAPDEGTGIGELETYLGLEPRARLGIWTNGATVARVYKLPSGEFRIVKGAGLPSPDENLILADDALTHESLQEPTQSSLNATFEVLLNLIVSADGRTTRPDARLNQLCNLLLVKLESDSAAYFASDGRVAFQVHDTPEKTAATINTLFQRLKRERPELFDQDEQDCILFNDNTIQSAVAELQMMNLGRIKPEVLSTAFQVFRNANLKVGDGQYFTPMRVVEACTRLMDITPEDRVIDPACGTGGFLSQAYLSVASLVKEEADAIRWANSKLYGVDLDSINVKLSRALMVGVGDGSTHVKLGDSIREDRWSSYGHALDDSFVDESYTVVITNPPFGKNLKVSAADASANAYTICKHSKNGTPSPRYCDTELGIVFVERAFRLLCEGGRLGIVLPETYFFSSSYAWFRSWIDAHFTLKGVLNIPMEAFQGFCRAKTNFYVLEKRPAGRQTSAMSSTSSWFVGGMTWVSNAATIGINKDGNELYKIDPNSHERTNELDNRALDDVLEVTDGAGETRTARYVATTKVSESLIGVPQYSDRSTVDEFRTWASGAIGDCDFITLGSLADAGLLLARAGHGSPSIDLRTGNVPYIKVSDLRNRQVNINRTNMVPRDVAERFWRGPDSGLEPWDVLTPARASKNIGEPSALLPNQTNLVLTKEIIVFRVMPSAPFDAFFLVWAMSLPQVLVQWKRVIFMQTNREDVGSRWREIEIPVLRDEAAALRLSSPYRKFYEGLAQLYRDFESQTAAW